ncbi:MAG TPA: high-affinity nickel-transport family protein [Candidatus Angelobacter sp.]|nr:high-affinity nickel-transport family protein [Candidatus Angelobacter sp.]
MISFFSILALGFFLGMRHATDPDHVIAVTTIVSRQRNIKKSALVGAFWGLGHTLTILLVGAAIILFGLVIPPRIGLSMELSVGLMLVLLGSMNVVGFVRSMPAGPIHSHESSSVVHAHYHSHGEYVHNHPHGHEPEQHFHSHENTPVAWLDRTLGRTGLYQPLRPLVIGIVHGLAGSAAVALLVLATIRNAYWAVGYLLIFGVGTIAGMMLITLSIASTFHLVGRSRQFSRYLGVASGLISLVFGLVVAYQICIVDGLLTGHPQWTPR